MSRIKTVVMQIHYLMIGHILRREDNNDCETALGCTPLKKRAQREIDNNPEKDSGSRKECRMEKLE